MADAFIYYRLKSNNTDNTATTPNGGYPDPNGSTTARNTFVTNMEANHNTAPNAQILKFTLPDELLESVSMNYENNIKDITIIVGYRAEQIEAKINRLIQSEDVSWKYAVLKPSSLSAKNIDINTTPEINSYNEIIEGGYSSTNLPFRTANRVENNADDIPKIIPNMYLNSVWVINITPKITIIPNNIS